MSRESTPKRELTARVVEAYQTKSVDFTFRGRAFTFALSQGLFSSANIDTGTRFLLKVFSRLLDEGARDGVPVPRTVLDAGSGVGVLGICAAAALTQARDKRGVDSDGLVSIRCQDRDELARCFTEFNAMRNDIPPANLAAHTEPLLAGPADARWDLILSNIPAKAGAPVLEDFIARSMNKLAPHGRVLIVVVNPLADFFRARIRQLEKEAPAFHEERGGGHTVMMYGAGEAPARGTGGRFPEDYPAYRRCGKAYNIEDISYTLNTIHGVADFDTPGEASQVAARLMSRLNLEKCAPLSTLLVHEPKQGHFPLWFARFLEKTASSTPRKPVNVVLSGRNILSLEVSRQNLTGTLFNSVRMVPALDMSVSGAALLEGGAAFSAVVAFPEQVPQTATLEAQWGGLRALLVDGGLALVALSSSDAERFDRRRPSDFARLGDVKRKGFRAIAYQKVVTPLDTAKTFAL
jgi:hypothetical protein